MQYTQFKSNAIRRKCFVICRGKHSWRTCYVVSAHLHDFRCLTCPQQIINFSGDLHQPLFYNWRWRERDSNENPLRLPVKCGFLFETQPVVNYPNVDIGCQGKKAKGKPDFIFYNNCTYFWFRNYLSKINNSQPCAPGKILRDAGF